MYASVLLFNTEHNIKKIYSTSSQEALFRKAINIQLCCVCVLNHLINKKTTIRYMYNISPPFRTHSHTQETNFYMHLFLNIEHLFLDFWKAIESSSYALLKAAGYTD